MPLSKNKPLLHDEDRAILRFEISVFLVACLVLSIVLATAATLIVQSMIPVIR